MKKTLMVLPMTYYTLLQCHAFWDMNYLVCKVNSEQSGNLDLKILDFFLKIIIEKIILP